MAIRFIDKQKGEVVSLSDNDAQNLIRLYPNKYIPIEKETYYVEGEDGKIQPVLGRELNRSIGDSGGSLLSHEQSVIKSAVRSEYSPLGQALKSFGSEAFTFGLLKDRPDLSDPVSVMIEKEREKQFGKWETAGGIAGMIGPLAVGGIGGVLAKGAKTGAKAMIGKGLQQAGKAPSALVFKGASKVGKSVAEKSGSKVLGKLAEAGTFIGAEGAIQGTKAAIQQRRENKADSLRKNWDGVLNQGVKGAGEAILATSAGVAVFGAGGWVAGKTLGKIKDTAVAAGLTPKKLAEASQLKFWGAEPGARSRKNMEGIKNWFSGGKTARTTEERKKALNNVERFLDDEVIPYSKQSINDKDGLLKAIEERADFVSENMKTGRDFLAKFVGNTENFIKGGMQTKKELVANIQARLTKELNKYSDIEKAGLLKPFVKDIENWTLGSKKQPGILATELNKPAEKIDISVVNRTMDYFSRKAKFLKREKKELKIDHAYRSVFRSLSDVEDRFFTKWGKLLQKPVTLKGHPEMKFDIKEAGNVVRGLKETKDLWSKLESVREFTDNAMPTGTKFLYNMHTISPREGILGITGAAIGGSMGGFTGAAIGGVAGTLASRGWATAQMSGKTYLWVTKPISRKLYQINNFMQKSKTVSGVKWALTRPNAGIKAMTEEAKMSTNSLSAYILGRGVGRLIDLKEEAESIPPYELASRGDNAMFKDVESYGGRDNAIQYVVNTAKAKRALIEIMPEYTYDIKGKRTISDKDQREYMKTVNQGITPMGFIDSIANQTLTAKGYNLLSKIHPNFLSHFNMNFIQGYKEGKIKNRFYYNFLKSMKSLTSDTIYSNLDQEEVPQQAQVPKRQMRRSQPGITAIAEGGGYA